MILPVLLLFFLTQKTFIEGIATTGIEGVSPRYAPGRLWSQRHTTRTANRVVDEFLRSPAKMTRELLCAGSSYPNIGWDVFHRLARGNACVGVSGKSQFF